MDDNRTQQIATGVYQNLGSRFGVNQTPTHTHNDIDTPKLSPTSLTNTKTLSPQTGGVLNGNTVVNIKPPVVVYPIPILPSVPTGTAPEGTLVYGAGAGKNATGLYLRVNSAWLFIGPYTP